VSDAGVVEGGGGVFRCCFFCFSVSLLQYLWVMSRFKRKGDRTDWGKGTYETKKADGTLLEKVYLLGEQKTMMGGPRWMDREVRNWNYGMRGLRSGWMLFPCRAGCKVVDPSLLAGLR